MSVLRVKIIAAGKITEISVSICDLFFSATKGNIEIYDVEFLLAVIVVINCGRGKLSFP
jgi:hypothetical protein